MGTFTLIIINLDVNNKHQTCEISGIKWFNYIDCIDTIRPYHISKKNIVKKAFQILKSKQKYFKELSCTTKININSDTNVSTSNSN